MARVSHAVNNPGGFLKQFANRWQHSESVVRLAKNFCLANHNIVYLLKPCQAQTKAITQVRRLLGEETGRRRWEVGANRSRRTEAGSSLEILATSIPDR